jgi:hypothetical protein
MFAIRIKLVIGTIYAIGLVAISTYVPWVMGPFRVSWGYARFWTSPNRACRLDLQRMFIELLAWTALLAASYMIAVLANSYRRVIHL